jgi:hypothetical protein
MTFSARFSFFRTTRTTTRIIPTGRPHRRTCPPRPFTRVLTRFRRSSRASFLRFQRPCAPRKRHRCASWTGLASREDRAAVVGDELHGQRGRRRGSSRPDVLTGERARPGRSPGFLSSLPKALRTAEKAPLCVLDGARVERGSSTAGGTSRTTRTTTRIIPTGRPHRRTCPPRPFTRVLTRFPPTTACRCRRPCL